MHNTIRSDRYTPTPYQEELSRLFVKQNKSYSLTEGDPANNRLSSGCQDVIPTGNPGLGLGLGLGLDSGLGLDKDKDKDNKKTITTVLNSYAPYGSELRNALNSFKEMREKMKKPLTVRALEMALKELDNLSGEDEQTKIAIIDQTLEHGWQKFYELKVNGQSQQHKADKQEAVNKWLNS